MAPPRVVTPSQLGSGYAATPVELRCESWGTRPELRRNSGRVAASFGSSCAVFRVELVVSFRSAEAAFGWAGNERRLARRRRGPLRRVLVAAPRSALRVADGAVIGASMCKDSHSLYSILFANDARSSSSALHTSRSLGDRELGASSTLLEAASRTTRACVAIRRKCACINYPRTPSAHTQRPHALINPALTNTCVPGVGCTQERRERAHG